MMTCGFWNSHRSEINCVERLALDSRGRLAMLDGKRIGSIIILTASALILVCSQNTSAQKPASDPISVSDLFRMLANQPDHIADRTIVVNDNVVKMKVAKKHDRIRYEFYPLDQADSLRDESYRHYKLITIGKINQPAIALDPQEKTYAEAPETFKMAAFDVEAFLKNAPAEMGKLKTESAGTENIEGIEANKIRITFEGNPEEMYLYFAKDTKNLFLRMDSGSVKQVRGSYTLSNVSLDVPDELFEIPKDYKRVKFDSMVALLKQKALK